MFWLLAALDLALFSFGSRRLAQAGGLAAKQQRPSGDAHRLEADQTATGTGPFRLPDKNAVRLITACMARTLGLSTVYELGGPISGVAMPAHQEVSNPGLQLRYQR